MTRAEAELFARDAVRSEIILRMGARRADSVAIYRKAVSMVTPDMTAKQLDAIADYLAGPLMKRGN